MFGNVDETINSILWGFVLAPFVIIALIIFLSIEMRKLREKDKDDPPDIPPGM